MARGTVDLTQVALGAGGKAFVGRRHQPDRLRRLRNLFRSAGPGAGRHRRFSEPARRGQRRQFRAGRESDFARRIRHAVRHGPRQEQPDRRAALPGVAERRQRADQQQARADVLRQFRDSSTCWCPSPPPVPRRPSWCRQRRQLEYRDGAGRRDLARHLHHRPIGQRRRRHPARRLQPGERRQARRRRRDGADLSDRAGHGDSHL